MKINNKLIEIDFNGKTIDSIKFKNEETLNQTKQWVKKFPMMFPAIGLNNTFKYKKKDWPIQKHGFWNEIDFDVIQNSNSIVLNGKVDRDDYPAYVEVEQYIMLNNNVIDILTKVTGEPAPMQIGYHPAFKVDKGDMKIKGKAHVITADFKDKVEEIDVDNINDLPWEGNDTFIFEQSEFTLHNDNYDLKVSTNMKYIALWTIDTKYICIEPYSDLPGVFGDKSTNSIVDDTDWTIKIEYIERNK